ncbi:GMP synthase [Paraflavisolibacter sp. H34]|uniref:type 1 glutamine amidotransferase n=1 Tax=Huijunlia imazamoxiresistens TaxID=3127457 RepID=UPI003015E5B0
MIRIAILDLYEGQPNQGMRCLREIITQWSAEHRLEVETHEFEVRHSGQVPDLSYDIYLSSGGPGSPLDGMGSGWEKAYFHWLSGIENWNNHPDPTHKKFVFFICHSFELVCRHYAVAQVIRRKSTAFGVFPVHLTPAGQTETIFDELANPFYVVDSRDWQVVQPNHHKLNMMGAQVLCIEKERPHVPLERAVMGIRFNPYMVGTQFHPEADAVGMSVYLQTDEQKQRLIKNHGEAKWHDIMEGLHDPGKIMNTYNRILPNFLNHAARHRHGQIIEI